MMMLSVWKPLSQYIVSRGPRYFSRTLSKQTPFSLDEGDDDDEYRSFNNMYVDMFTPKRDLKEEDDERVNSKKAVDELEELNQEMDELCKVGYDTLAAHELEEVVKNEGRFILHSISTDPYYNLALEDYLFRHTPVSGRFANQRLLFYKNNNCVVIGKNQTVWKEVFLNNVIQRGYELIRRLSGGGAVVHDLGNVNYSYITSRKEFDRYFFNKLIIQWLMDRYPKISLQLNSRGDITLNGSKVSGSAFKIAREKAYHHGTMLVHSNLSNFKGLLKPDEIEGIVWDCNSVDSVRSQVSNISLESTQDFIDACIMGFKEHFSPIANHNMIPVYCCDRNTTMNDDIQRTIDKLKSDEWKYLSGPNFSVNIENGNHEISVRKGSIIKSTIPDTVGMKFKEFAQDFPQLL